MKHTIGNRIIILLILLLTINSCSDKTQREKTQLEFDHLVIFANDFQIEDSLNNNFLTLGEKLTTEHKNQGTIGHYFLFHNMFIEFLYLKDSTIAQQNEKRFRSMYTKRWNQKETTCPFSIGLSLTPFDSAQSDYPVLPYYSLDSPEGEYYLMAAENKDLSQPLIYSSSPNRTYHKLDSLSQVDEYYEDMVRQDFKNYLTHPSGIKHLTKMIVSVPEGVKGQNIDQLQQLENVEVRSDKEYALTLIFDNQLQGKQMIIDGSFPLTLKY